MVRGRLFLASSKMCKMSLSSVGPRRTKTGGTQSQIRFKPAYNPYTEPSMEIFGYHPDLKKWTEIGNSGMFRPEMLRPMGLPKVKTNYKKKESEMAHKKHGDSGLGLLAV